MAAPVAAVETPSYEADSERDGVAQKRTRDDDEDGDCCGSPPAEKRAAADAPLRCEECGAAPATLFCTACSALLCGGCDAKVHGGSAVAARHRRVATELSAAEAAAADDDDEEEPTATTTTTAAATAASPAPFVAPADARRTLERIAAKAGAVASATAESLATLQHSAAKVEAAEAFKDLREAIVMRERELAETIAEKLFAAQKDLTARMARATEIGEKAQALLQLQQAQASEEQAAQAEEAAWQLSDLCSGSLPTTPSFGHGKCKEAVAALVQAVQQAGEVYDTEIHTAVDSGADFCFVGGSSYLLSSNKRRAIRSGAMLGWAYVLGSRTLAANSVCTWSVRICETSFSTVMVGAVPASCPYGSGWFLDCSATELALYSPATASPSWNCGSNKSVGQGSTVTVTLDTRRGTMAFAVDGVPLLSGGEDAITGIDTESDAMLPAVLLFHDNDCVELLPI